MQIIGRALDVKNFTTFIYQQIELKNFSYRIEKQEDIEKIIEEKIEEMLAEVEVETENTHNNTGEVNGNNINSLNANKSKTSSNSIFLSIIFL